MITCTASRFDRDDDDTGKECGEPATVHVTITGADRAKGLRPESIATPWNLDKAPRCDRCANMDRRIVAKMFPGASFDAEPIGP